MVRRMERLLMMMYFIMVRIGAMFKTGRANRITNEPRLCSPDWNVSNTKRVIVFARPGTITRT